MDKKRNDQDQESLLDDLIRTCNELHETSNRVNEQSISHGYSGPLHWQHSCDQTIAVPRQTLTFHLELDTTSSAEFDDIFCVRLHGELPEALVYDRTLSVLVDGKPSQPTNHSLSRTLDVAFNRIAAGCKVVMIYQTRVRFDAEPTAVRLDRLDMQWSWVSRSRKLVAHNPHLSIPAKHMVMSPETAQSLQPL